MFRDKYPLAWTFHQNTCRNQLNSLAPAPGTTSPDGFKEYLHAPTVPLPSPVLSEKPFGDLLSERFSCRRFTGSPITLQQLSNLLFAAYGVRGTVMLNQAELIERTIPSGGGLYPLEFYLIVNRTEGLAPGIYHYVPAPPLLEQIQLMELPPVFISTLFMQQPYVADAAVILVAASRIERTMKKYLDRGYRYILYEAGHAFQNVNLMATALGLGSMNIGGFYDEDLSRVLGIDMEEEIPLYAMAIGAPDGDRISGRIP